MKASNLLRRLREIRERNQGVTLVEMMVVVFILGILAGVSILIITTIFNANIQGGQGVNQQSTIQQSNGFFNKWVGATTQGNIGMVSSDGESVNRKSIAGDQFTMVANGYCYRIMYFDQAQALVSVSQPIDPTTKTCQTGSSGIAPVAGPAGSPGTDPVLSQMNLSTGAVTGTLPSQANAFTIAQNVTKVSPSSTPFAFDNAAAAALPTDAVAGTYQSQNDPFYSNPTNLNNVASVQVNLNVLGAKPGTTPSIGPKLYSQQFFAANQAPSSGGTASAGGSGTAFSARLATTGPLPSNTLNSGTLTASSSGSLGQIDGVNVNVGDRVLVDAEANAAKDGVYDVVDTGSSASAGSTPADALPNLPVLDGLTSVDKPLGSTAGKWSLLSFGGTKVQNGAGSSVTVSDTGNVSSSTGWNPDSASQVSGAYWNPSAFSGSGSNVGTAASVKVSVTSCGSGLSGRYVALWLNMGAPASGESGYEALFTCTGTNTTSNVEIDKWVAGSKTVLQTSSSPQNLVAGTTLAITDVGGTISVYLNGGAGFTQLISANDTTFTSGSVGLMGSGSNGSYANFRGGTINTSAGSAGSPWKLVRSTGADTTADYLASGDFPPGSLVTVSEGSQNSSSIWQLQALSPAQGWQLDSNAQNYAIKAGANSVGSKELKASSVGSSNLQTHAVGPAALGLNAIEVCLTANNQRTMYGLLPQGYSYALDYQYLGPWGACPGGVGLGGATVANGKSNNICPDQNQVQGYMTCGAYVQIPASQLPPAGDPIMVTYTLDAVTDQAANNMIAYLGVGSSPCSSGPSAAHSGNGVNAAQCLLGGSFAIVGGGASWTRNSISNTWMVPSTGSAMDFQVAVANGDANSWVYQGNLTIVPL